MRTSHPAPCLVCRILPNAGSNAVVRSQCRARHMNQYTHTHTDHPYNGCYRTGMNTVWWDLRKHSIPLPESARESFREVTVASSRTGRDRRAAGARGRLCPATLGVRGGPREALGASGTSLLTVSSHISPMGMGLPRPDPDRWGQDRAIDWI